MASIVRILGAVCVVLAAMSSGACADARRGDGPQHPALIFPTKLAEGEQEPKPGDAGGTQTSADSPTPSEGPVAPAALPGDLPDPAPLQTRDYWQLQFEHRAGAVHLIAVQPVHFDQPVSTPRQIGRYALELWIGRELIDRVRFDFPLLAGEAPPAEPVRPLHDPPRFAPGADVGRTVLLPNSDRATRLVLIDRATRQTSELAWPPEMVGKTTRVLEPPGASSAGR